MGLTSLFAMCCCIFNLYVSLNSFSPLSNSNTLIYLWNRANYHRRQSYLSFLSCIHLSKKNDRFACYQSHLYCMQPFSLCAKSLQVLWRMAEVKKGENESQKEETQSTGRIFPTENRLIFIKDEIELMKELVLFRWISSRKKHYYDICYIYHYFYRDTTALSIITFQNEKKKLALREGNKIKWNIKIVTITCFSRQSEDTT